MKAGYVAFVRAINVRGHAKVTMPVLKQAFVTAGCDKVGTLIQSGNVIFYVGRQEAASAFDAIRAELRKLLSIEATVVFRETREVREMMKTSPFSHLDASADAKLYVAFLSREPARKPRFPIVSPKEGLEAIGMRRLDVFVVSRRKKNGGYGFPNNFIEESLQVPATTRNWSTLARVAASSP